MNWCYFFGDHLWKDMRLKVTEQVRENIVKNSPLTIEDDEGRILFEYCTRCGHVRVKERCTEVEEPKPIWYKPWTWIYY